MDYIYKIEVEYFLRDSKYHWKLKHKKKNSSFLSWRVCLTGCNDSIDNAWVDAVSAIDKLGGDINI